MSYNGILTYALPEISGPGATVWEFSVEDVQGKALTPFVSLNQATKVLQLNPNNEIYAGNTYYWLLVVREKDSQKFVREIEMQITVLEAVRLNYEAVITDGLTGSG